MDDKKLVILTILIIAISVGMGYLEDENALTGAQFVTVRPDPTVSLPPTPIKATSCDADSECEIKNIKATSIIEPLNISSNSGRVRIFGDIILADPGMDPSNVASIHILRGPFGSGGGIVLDPYPNLPLPPSSRGKKGDIVALGRLVSTGIILAQDSVRVKKDLVVEEKIRFADLRLSGNRTSGPAPRINGYVCVDWQGNLFRSQTPCT